MGPTTSVSHCIKYLVVERYPHIWLLRFLSPYSPLLLFLKSYNIVKNCRALSLHHISLLFSAFLDKPRRSLSEPERDMDTESGEWLDRSLYEKLEEPGESNVQATHTMTTRYPLRSLLIRMSLI